jgi:hypothetical protein
MLEKSFGLLFFLKQPRNYEGGSMYIYPSVTVDGIPKELSVKSHGRLSGGMPKRTGLVRCCLETVSNIELISLLFIKKAI